MKSFLAFSNLLIGPVVTNHLFREKMCLLSPHTKFFVRNEKTDSDEYQLIKEKKSFLLNFFVHFWLFMTCTHSFSILKVQQTKPSKMCLIFYNIENYDLRVII